MTKTKRKKTPSQKVAVKEVTSILKCRRKRFENSKASNVYLLIYPMLRIGDRQNILKLGVALDLIDDRFSDHVTYQNEWIEEYWPDVRRKVKTYSLVIRISPKE